MLTCIIFFDLCCLVLYMKIYVELCVFVYCYVILIKKKIKTKKKTYLLFDSQL